MNTLPLRITLYGYELTQIERNEHAAIYAQSKPGHEPIAWEVVRIAQAAASTIMGREYPEREVYPGPEQWGAAGWTCMSLADARARYDRLAKQQQSGYESRHG